MGNPEINIGGVNHYAGGVLSSWALCVHYGDAGIAVGATEIPAWSWSPEEPMPALLGDLGPIALADLNQGANGAHLFASINARPGAWFDWYRQMVDPQLRTPAQQAEIKEAIRDELLRRLAAAL